MDNSKKDSLVMTLVHIGIWGTILLLPLAMNLFITGGDSPVKGIAWGFTALMVSPFLIYTINYVAFVPRLLFSDNRTKKTWFYIANVLLLLVLDMRFIFPKAIPEDVRAAIPFADNEIWGLYAMITLLMALFQTLFILLAVGIRYIMRSHQQKIALQEAKRQNAEAELSWLKNQLNPHFLFNTLNNISSLTQIDPDKAQESIGQLSSLLRYALYESNANLVPLDGEIEFMEDYVDLMSLRCNNLTTVTKEFITPGGSVQIAPLLFISLIENAFKHGVNSRHESNVDVKLYPDGDDLVFRCSNSYFEKTGKDEIGSGIGLENMKRRLELIYPGQYKYDVKVEDGQYKSVVILKGLLSRKKEEKTEE